MSVTPSYNARRAARRASAARLLRLVRPRLVAALVALGAVAPANAQVAVVRNSPLLAQPTKGARSLGTLLRGGTVASGPTLGGWQQVTLDGWLEAGFLGGKVDTFPRSVRRNGSTLRASASPTARAVARLNGGTGLQLIGTSGRFSRVQFVAWVRTEGLGRPNGAAAQASGRGVRPVPPKAVDAAPSLLAAPAPAEAALIPDGALKPAGSRGADVRLAPDGRILASVRPQAVLVPQARDRGWVRVRLEGWVRERDLMPADSALRGIRSAADLRSDPEGTKGVTVRWVVDVLGLQTADGLRRDLSEGEQYLLARGPDGEEALLYLAIPPTLLETARAWPQMSRALVVARVRTGRSEPTGVPVLDVQSLSKP